MTPDVQRLKPHLEALPIFPLPTAVLLPYEVLPLHVFEPRYREMIADMLAGNRPMAIAQLATGWEGDYEGRPPVEPLCGAGFLTRHEKLPDGCYNVMIRGIARVRIVEELPPKHDYREVRATIVEDMATHAEPAQAADSVEDVKRLLFALCAARPGPASGTLAQLAARAEDSGTLADIVSAALLTDFTQRKRSLVSLDPVERLGIAKSAIAELLAGSASTTDARLRN